MMGSTTGGRGVHVKVWVKWVMMIGIHVYMGSGRGVICQMVKWWMNLGCLLKRCQLPSNFLHVVGTNVSLPPCMQYPNPQITMVTVYFQCFIFPHS